MQEKKDYHVISKFYDRLMGEKKYKIWDNLIREVTEKYDVKKGTCLDVCCGTGNITKLLLKQGYNPVGIDNSNDMIEVARSKFSEYKFYCCDVRDFTLKKEGKFSFAVSFYDSLNYILSDDDMIAMFKSVKATLEPGGIFLFDMNPQEHVTVSQKNKPRVFEDEDFYVIFRFGGENRIWELYMDFFVKQTDGSYQLIRELHVERAYDEDDIRTLLAKAGFEVLEVRTEDKVYEDGLSHLSRLYFVAKSKEE